MKLSMAQQKVLDLMANGWELGCSMGGLSGRGFWLQKGGLGRGGEALNINYRTAHKLLELNLIKVMGKGFPTRKYGLVGGIKK